MRKSGSVKLQPNLFLMREIETGAVFTKTKIQRINMYIDRNCSLCEDQAEDRTYVCELPILSKDLEKAVYMLQMESFSGSGPEPEFGGIKVAVTSKLIGTGKNYRML